MQNPKPTQANLRPSPHMSSTRKPLLNCTAPLGLRNLERCFLVLLRLLNLQASSSPQHLHVQHHDQRICSSIAYANSRHFVLFRHAELWFVPNNYTFPPLIKACTVLIPNSKLSGRLVHGHVVKFGYRDDPFVLGSLIEFYSVIHDMETAKLVFDKSPKRDVVVWTAMIDGYGKAGDVENARALFDEMPERNAISWSAMMAAYSRVSHFREVLSLFRQMQEVGTKPNESVLVSVLTASAHLGAVTQGLWVHSYAKRYNLESNTILATALVDMYSKCGYVEAALWVFEGISNKDARAWNAMIAGVAMNGDARKSLELFNKMVEYGGVQPTETTFVAVLTACTHAKMVDKGLELFDQMGNLYGVKPRLEHYGCVVDLLARAGLVEEAEKFTEVKMGGLRRGMSMCGEHYWLHAEFMGMLKLGTEFGKSSLRWE
ncbi:Tetratricopeptide repeat-like superfamily protein [Prunus dulcis]|uniref:Tetratricopeptide repeat-like superfamily protein n=1 Tax=Prunus dulcis TaxID=3755 RepID=A0A4Y1RXN3_PRUDU|nr:Tetratricopeptide repeat-like superfamily protein [Prunus dulcis]